MLISAGCGGGCPPCGGGGCPAQTWGIITTEEFGSGTIVCIADYGGLVLTCHRHALNAPLFTAIFSRVSGTVAGMTSVSPTSWPNDAGSGFEPTVAYTSGGSLSGIGCLYAGLRGDATPDVPSNALDIADWVRSGGVLLLIVENDEVLNNAIPECNELLGNMGACSFFESVVIPPILCSLSTDGLGGIMSANTSHSWASVTEDQRYVKAARAWGQEWLYRSSDGPVVLECPSINADPYGIINAPGTLGGVAFSVCLALETTTDPEGRWYGEKDVVLSCGTKTLGIRIYCDGEWKADIINVTDDVTETFPLEPTTTDPLDALLSETVANFCGSDALVVGFSTCTDPPTFPCCPDIDPAALCCLSGIAELEINEDFALGDYGDMHVSGTLGWDSVGGKWGPGNITWTANCPGAQPDGEEVWEDSTIECAGDGTFDLKVGGVTVATATAACSIPLHLAFENITPPLLCDPGIDPPPDPSVTLPFDMPEE